MSSKENKTGIIIFLLATAVQAGVSLLFVLQDPSQEKNVFLMGYSLSRLLFAAIFLMIMAVCLYGIVAVWGNKTSLHESMIQKLEQPGRLTLVFGGLLVFILTNAISLNVAYSYYAGTRIIARHVLSFENLQIGLRSLLWPIQAYWMSLIPFFKWCLVLGVDVFIYFMWAGTQSGSDGQIGYQRPWQKWILSGFSIIFIPVTAFLVYFPADQPLILRFSGNVDWLILLLIVACMGVLITLVNYRPRSIRFLMFGLLALGIIVNLVDNSYSSVQGLLFQKSDHTFYSLASSEKYLLRPYVIYHSLSSEYRGREIHINQSILDRFSLSEERLITMGRLSKVMILDDEMILDEESADQLKNMPNIQIRLPLDNSEEPADTLWVFIKPATNDFTVVQTWQTVTGKIFVIPVTPETAFLGKSQ